jgi:large repetitive protein
MITPIIPLPEGTNNLTATQTDIAGNVSPTMPIVVIIDSIPPFNPTV